MAENGFLSSALKLFTGGDAATPSRIETSVPDEADSSLQRQAAAAQGVSALVAAEGSASAVPCITPTRALSIRQAHAIRGCLRAGSLGWSDEASTGGALSPGGGASPGGGGAGGAVSVLPPGQVSTRRLAEFTRTLEARSVNTESLRRLSWFGVPARYRTASWQILLGHLPASSDRAADSLQRKRAEYESFLAAVSGRGGSGVGKSEAEQRMVRQVLVDCPRTMPGIKLFHTTWVQRSLARVLTAYASRHFATGYVQGLNDLACPFYAVFLSPWAALDSDEEIIAAIPADELADVEADVYWCLTRTLEGIQSHYLASQPGLHTMMASLRELCVRIDERLVIHLEKNDVEFKTFSFRWMNCLLCRELPMRLIVRLWDTYIAESSHAVRDGFEAFHVYVCAALLDKFKPRLLERNTHELLTFLQALDKETASWGVAEVEELLSKAYVFTQMFPGIVSPLSS